VLQTDFQWNARTVLRPAILAAWLLLLSSCAAHSRDRTPVPMREIAVSDISSCLASLRGPAISPMAELDASNIRLLNWNVQKNNRSNWRRDFAQFSSERNLVLVQEASLREDSIASMDSSRFWSFAAGYSRSGAISGVLTMSTARPMAQCSFVSYEPVLRTPKATSITQYGLTSTDETLIVVNIHAINFSLGLGAFQNQFDQVREVLEAHSGPIILSGDFNTWRKKRIEFIDALTLELGLSALQFPEDHRVTRLGRYLDHIYVRGLSPLESKTAVVDSSDHNPMTVTLRMYAEQNTSIQTGS
jgi:endonuclease/exonuclease/phosphatase (EEP) superfamily protein YafD